MGKVVDSMRRRKPYFEVPMVDLWEEEQASERLDGIYGSDLRKAMTTGVGHLANAFPDLREDRKAKLIGPNLEGVGWYPTVNEDSRAYLEPLPEKRSDFDAQPWTVLHGESHNFLEWDETKADSL